MIKFKENSLHNAFLDVDHEFSEGDNIPADTTLSLPSWLSLELSKLKTTAGNAADENLAENGRIAEIQTPSIFKENFQNILRVDSEVINLKEKSGYFYEFGMKICNVIDVKEWGDLLFKVYLQRMKQFSKISYHQQIQDCTKTIQKMTVKEYALFNIGRSSAISIRGWKAKGLKSG